MTDNPSEVVTLGEALMLFTSPPGTMLLQGAGLRTSFVGAESNFAIGLSRLGHCVRWLSVLGDDLFGQHILKTLRGESVDVSKVIVSNDGPTAVVFKNRRPGAEPEIFYYRSNSAMSRASAKTFDPESWRGAQNLYLTGITPALGASCRELVWRMIEDMKQQGARIWLDPNHRRKLWSEAEARLTLLKLMPQVDVVLAGASEGRMLTDHTDLKAIARSLRDAGAREIVLKAGDGDWQGLPTRRELAEFEKGSAESAR